MTFELIYNSWSSTLHIHTFCLSRQCIKYHIRTHHTNAKSIKWYFFQFLSFCHMLLWYYTYNMCFFCSGYCSYGHEYDTKLWYQKNNLFFSANTQMKWHEQSLKNDKIWNGLYRWICVMYLYLIPKMTHIPR